MSAQLLICNFAVFTCVSFFLTDASHDYHGSLARWLAVCQDPMAGCLMEVQLYIEWGLLQDTSASVNSA